MKTIKITLLSLFLMATSGMMAQEKANTEKPADRDARKEALITEKLELTDVEAKAFWPVYKEFKKEHETLRKNFKKTKEAGKKMDELSDEEVDKIIMESFDYKQKELDLKKKYHLKFKAILPIKKVAKLYHLEKKMRKDETKEGAPERPVRHEPRPKREDRN